VPLTFGDLEAGSVTLRMMTTNLSHSQGYQLPSLSREAGDHPTSHEPAFAFCAEEFGRLFPASVVDAMAGPARAISATWSSGGLFRLAARGRLPVLVATRMSLSFPVLLSAVPLYTVRRSAATDSQKQITDRSTRPISSATGSATAASRATSRSTSSTAGCPGTRRSASNSPTWPPEGITDPLTDHETVNRNLSPP